MVNTVKTKKCLIIADGPVPVPEHTKLEGGGLRCWGLAKGILANEKDVEVTVAYHDRFRKEKFTKFFEGIHITTHDKAEDVPALLADFDTVIISYCMGDLSVVVAEVIQPDQQLILDCNVPAYVEVSARDSTDVRHEYNLFQHDVHRFSRVLARGDLFLCASESQKEYYFGVISALGRVNPITYKEDLILVVPYGIYREVPVAKNKPIETMLGEAKSSSKKILWFGGIYPWFDLRVLADAIAVVNKKLPAKLIVVGAKNPFNGHPDFIEKYDEFVKYIQNKKLTKEILLQDWIPFSERADWYLDSDIVVLINKEGKENNLAWRTRLVDYMWASLPIVTNGGDPLSEIFLENRAAFRFKDLTAESIAEEILSILSNEKGLKEVKHNLHRIKSRFYWDTITLDLTHAIENHTKAADLLDGLVTPISTPVSRAGKVKKLVSKVAQIPAYTKKYGPRATYFTIRTTIVNKVSKYLPKKVEKHKNTIAVISHQLDISGAPFVLVDLVKELRKLNPKLRIDFHTFNPTHPDQIKTLNKAGIKPKIYMSRDIVPSFSNVSTVIINTIAHSPMLKDALLTALENGSLKKVLWYIHEDNPEYMFSDTQVNRMKKLIAQDKLVLFTAAAQTKQHYDEFFDTHKTRVQLYKIVTPKKYHKIRSSDDFKKLRFLLTGVAADGRKGQLTIFYAFVYFLNVYYNKSPKLYRDFELIYIGLGPDLHSQQLRNHAEKGLGKRFKAYDVLSKAKMLDITLKANITICYSLIECLPLFVYEGMTAGHPILRNDSSGMKEQLINGKNGYQLDSNDFMQVIEIIEKMLNKKKTTDQQLADMSKVSYEIAVAQENNTYRQFMDEIE